MRVQDRTGVASGDGQTGPAEREKLALSGLHASVSRHHRTRRRSSPPQTPALDNCAPNPDPHACHSWHNRSNLDRSAGHSPPIGPLSGPLSYAFSHPKAPHARAVLGLCPGLLCVAHAGEQPSRHGYHCKRLYHRPSSRRPSRSSVNPFHHLENTRLLNAGRPGSVLFLNVFSTAAVATVHPRACMFTIATAAGGGPRH